MKISILTIMPALFDSFLQAPVIARAIRKGALEVELVDIREYAPGSFRHIDDSPFGGGAGMVLRCQPVLDALQACRERYAAGCADDWKDCEEDCEDNRDEAWRPEGTGNSGICSKNQLQEVDSVCCPTAGISESGICNENPLQEGGNGQAEGRGPDAEEGTARRSHTILLSPAGTPYTQKKAHCLAKMSHLILLCGHYEGFDARIYPHADELVSVGDYVLTGGELAAQVIVDSVARLLPGSLRETSTQEESFENGLLEYPQYTQPAVYEGEAVPEVLRSGDHARIRRWRLQQALLWTKKMRPDLFEAHTLTEEERELLEEQQEMK